MAKVLIYSARTCVFCRMAEKLLEKKGIQLEKIMVDEDPVRREEMIRLTGQISVPQIIIDNKQVGGFRELTALEHSGELNALLGIEK